MIPKILHHVWIGDKQPNELHRECMDQAIRLHPSFQYMLHDSDEVLYHPALRGVHAEVQQFYRMVGEKGRRPIEYQADVLKLCALYCYGGIVLDSDEWLLKPFDALLQRKHVFTSINGPETPMLIGEHVLGAEPEDEFVWRVIVAFIQQRVDTTGSMTPHLGMHLRKAGIPFLPRMYFAPHGRDEPDTDEVNYRTHDVTHGIHCYSNHHYDIAKLKQL